MSGNSLRRLSFGDNCCMNDRMNFVWVCSCLWFLYVSGTAAASLSDDEFSREWCHGDSCGAPSVYVMSPEDGQAIDISGETPDFTMHIMLHVPDRVHLNESVNCVAAVSISLVAFFQNPCSTFSDKKYESGVVKLFFEPVLADTVARLSLEGPVPVEVSVKLNEYTVASDSILLSFSRTIRGKDGAVASPSPQTLQKQMKSHTFSWKKVCKRLQNEPVAWPAGAKSNHDALVEWVCNVQSRARDCLLADFFPGGTGNRLMALLGYILMAIRLSLCVVILEHDLAPLGLLDAFEVASVFSESDLLSIARCKRYEKRFCGLLDNPSCSTVGVPGRLEPPHFFVHPWRLLTIPKDSPREDIMQHLGLGERVIASEARSIVGMAGLLALNTSIVASQMEAAMQRGYFSVRVRRYRMYSMPFPPYVLSAPFMRDWLDRVGGTQLALAALVQRLGIFKIRGDDFSKRYDIALHVRRSRRDDFTHFPRESRFSISEMLQQFVDCAGSAAHIPLDRASVYIATEWSDVQSVVTERLIKLGFTADKISGTHSVFSHVNGPDGPEDAAVYDLHVLARAKILIGTAGSTFSAAAATLRMQHARVIDSGYYIVFPGNHDGHACLQGSSAMSGLVTEDTPLPAPVTSLPLISSSRRFFNSAISERSEYLLRHLKVTAGHSIIWQQQKNVTEGQK